MEKKSILVIFICLFLISLVSAQPPGDIFLSVGDKNLEIEFPAIRYLQINTEHTFNFHVFNKSNGIPVTSGIGCYFHMFDASGKHIVDLFNDTIGDFAFDYQFSIPGDSFSNIGSYSYVIQCNSSSQGGFVTVPFLVTKTGTALETPEALIYSILACGVLLLFIISFYFMITVEYGNNINEKGAVIKLTKTKYVKLGLILLTWVLFTWFLNILIGLSDNFVSLTMYYGLFGFIFETMNNLALPLGIVIIVICLFEIIRDANIQKAISKFGSSK